MNNKWNSLTNNLNSQQAKMVAKMLQKQEEHFEKQTNLCGPYYCSPSGEYVTVDEAADPKYEPCVAFHVADKSRPTTKDYIKYVYDPQGETYHKLTPNRAALDDDKPTPRGYVVYGACILINVKEIPDWVIIEVFKREPTLYNPIDDPLGPFAKFAFPLVRKTYPKLIAQDIVSVQPLVQPTSLVFYQKLKYGATKGNAGPTK